MEVQSPRRRILIADDEPGVRRFVRSSLEPDYDIIEAVDGRKVVGIVESTAIDLVITDVCMPEKDGLETIQALRRTGRDVKIVAISGAFEGLFLNAARAFGAHATLSKPFGPAELLECVRSLLGEPEAA
jgi:CheY-like chemotaxis protein